MKYVTIGTAGHIDHGKSALVEALTGTHPDRLEEEKRRGITIDLGFAHLDLGADLRAGFVDVPGHERFVKNMLAGVGGIDLVLLVVAADESVKPQTREHFDICRLLGIRRGLVAVTKADLVEREIVDLVALEVQEFVAGSFLEGSPILPVSARTGEGMENLKAELGRLASLVPAREAGLPFRLPLDRAFVMKGFGVVVTGTLIAGRISKEAEVEILPPGRRARVRGIQAHNQPAEFAVAGQRTALNLAGVEAGELARGMVLAEPGLFQPSERLDCRLELLASARPLKNRARVHFHSGTCEMLAEVVLLENREMAPGERAYAQLRLAGPGLFLPGDRFIIRQFSPVTTLGGGTVLDNLPGRHHAADAELLRLFQAVESGDAEARLELLVRLEEEATPRAMVERTGWPLEEVLRLSKSLEAVQRLVRLGSPPSLLVHPRQVAALSESIVRELEQFHAANPLLPGLAKEELRARVAAHRGGPSSGPPAKASGRQAGERAPRPNATAPSPALFDALLAGLGERGQVISEGERVRLRGREIRLSAEESAAKEALSGAFERAGLAVPSAREVLDSLRLDRERTARILQILFKEKVLVRVTEELIFHRAALEGLRRTLAERKQRNPRLSVADFKDLTGLSRKYAIPLLEYFDRERVTRREGDARIIL